MRLIQRNATARRASVCLAALLAAAAPLGAAFLELSPSDTGGFTLVESPTPSAVAALQAAGKRPLVVSEEFGEEAVAFTNWAANAAAVAFAQLPRRHLMHTWKLLGVKTLKTVRFDPEGSATRFRREASFLAFKGGADGIWIPDADRLPPGWREALDEAREDRRVLLYLKSLADEAAANGDPFIRIESRRVGFWFSSMPADWENADTLRLECVAWARRLEQLLGKTPATLPEKRSNPSEPQTLAFTPYAGADPKPTQIQMKKLDEKIDFGGGLSFAADKGGFSISYSTTEGPPLAKGTLPGGTLDFRLYLPGENQGEFLPYRFHCDLNPAWYSAKRAPARGREHSLFGIDERFRPFSVAYGVNNSRVWTWPRLRDFGPDYPDPHPSVSVTGNKNGGWTATLSCKWAYLCGHWPMQREGKSDMWFVGLERSRETGGPLAGRVIWPRGGKAFFKVFAAAMKPGDMTTVYSTELDRTKKVWTTAAEERLYPYAQTQKPSFNRFDRESDRIFWERLVEPLCISNENAWIIIETRKDHPSKLPAQTETVKSAIWRNFERMGRLSHDVGLRRLVYLEDRFAGRELPPLPPKRKTAAEIALEHEEPDADYDPDGLQLDDKEF